MSEGYATPKADDDLYYERYREGIQAYREQAEQEDEEEDDEVDDDDSPDPENS